jgi:NADP-dependent 3-hydroxy acid dehydrogenase YdfG
MAKQQPRILTGQVAAITGGARGIGRATAEAFVRQGMRVAIGDLDLELARATAAEIGGETAAFRLDVTERASTQDFVASVEIAFGPIDVFVNNAGIMSLSHFLLEEDEAARRMFDINVHGVLHGMKAVLPGMVQRGRGHVVNIASQAGKFGFAGGASYCGTKYAVVGVTESVRSELRLMGADGVWLSVVMPAIVNTELGEGLSKPLGQKDIQPTDVADAVVEAVQTGKFDVWVPRENVGVYALSALLPRRPREAVGRVMRADRTLWAVDESARRGYELRAARSEPALAAGDDESAAD